MTSDILDLDVLFDLGLPLGIHDDLWGLEGGSRHKLQVGIANQLPEQTKKYEIKIKINE
jgi:hypothetical protein